jgi:hypothetical protein
MSLLYTFSTGSTEVYSLPSYSSVTSAQTVSQIDAGSVNSVYNSTYQKIFAGPSQSISTTGLTIYNSGNTKTVINISGDTYGIAVDNTNNLVAITKTGPGEDVVVVVDASSDTVVSTIDVVEFGSYKGGIASDNNGYCYVVGSSSAMTKVDIVNGVTADTINIGGSGETPKKVIFNGVSNFIYVLNPVSGVKSFDASDNSQLNTLSITANTDFFVFNPDKEYIYLGNITGVTDDFVITTLSRNLALISETFIYSGASTGDSQLVFGFYSPDTQYLYVGDVNSDSILVLTT